MGALTAFWALLFPMLIVGLFFVWPPPVAGPWLEVYPPTVTVSPSGFQQFTAKIWNVEDADIAWSSWDGTITPTGLFTAPAAGTAVTVTATRKSERSQVGTALVVLGPSLELRPAYSELGPSQTAHF